MPPPRTAGRSQRCAACRPRRRRAVVRLTAVALLAVIYLLVTWLQWLALFAALLRWAGDGQTWRIGRLLDRRISEVPPAG